MSLNLHPGCLDRLTALVEAALRDTTVTLGCLPDSTTGLSQLGDAHTALPQAALARAEAYVGERPVFQFVFQTLFRELRLLRELDASDDPVPLTSIAGYENSVEVARRLVSAFDALPYEYRVTVELPEDLSKIFTSIPKDFFVAPDIIITRIDDDFDTRFPLTTGNDRRDKELFGTNTLLTLFEPKKWTPHGQCIQICASGFIGEFPGGPTVADSISQVKSFCGLGMAMRFLSLDRRYILRNLPQQNKALVHIKVGDAWTFQSTIVIDEDLTRSIYELKADTLGGLLDTEEKIQNSVKNDCEKLARALHVTDHAPPLLLAGQWLFDSRVGSDELLSFIQSTVVMEILLGEKKVADLMGVGALLRNRCAYLISNTREQREKVIADFEKIYDVRSSIVHAGKKRLSEADRLLLSQLHWMCNRVLQEEIKLLAAN